MRLTHHARRRAQQRGIPSDAIAIILRYGTLLPAYGPAEKYTLTQRDVRELVGESLVHKGESGRLVGRSIVATPNGVVITAY